MQYKEDFQRLCRIYDIAKLYHTLFGFLNPTSAIEVFELMQLNTNEIAYTGDSKIDMITASNANMDSIGVLWGFRDYNELKKNKATYIVKNPEEIIKIIF